MFKTEDQGEDWKSVVELYKRLNIDSEESESVQAGKTVFYYLLRGHLLGLILYLVIVGLDFAGYAGSCWQGSDSAGVCKFSQELAMNLVFTMIIWFPILGFSYTYAFSKRNNAIGWKSNVTTALIAMVFTVFLAVLFIPSIGYHPANDGSLEFQRTQRELEASDQRGRGSDDAASQGGQSTTRRGHGG